MVKLRSFFVFVFTCVACGGSFSSHDGVGAGGGSGGDANGGQSSAAGASDTSGGGETSSAGSNSGGAAGGSGGGAGSGKGGAATAGSSGANGGDQCAKLKEQYQAALEEARVCDLGSMDQCSPSSTVEPLNCGCAVLVNAQSESATVAKKARQAYRDAKCADGTVCPAIACAQPVSASCAPAAIGATFVCAAGSVAN